MKDCRVLYVGVYRLNNVMAMKMISAERFPLHLTQRSTKTN